MRVTIRPELVFGCGRARAMRTPGSNLIFVTPKELTKAGYCEINAASCRIGRSGGVVLICLRSVAGHVNWESRARASDVADIRCCQQRIATAKGRPHVSPPFIRRHDNSIVIPMTSQVSPDKIGNAILQSVEHGAFPQDEDVASASVPSSALPKLLDIVGKAKEDAKVRDDQRQSHIKLMCWL
jgi:hypothetical protein